MNDVKEMGEAPLGRLLLKFSLPTIAMMVVNGLYNFIDRIFIGQGMGTDALAAVTAGFPMMIIAMAVGALFSVGTSTLVSIAMGAGRQDEARNILGQGFAASLASALLVAGLGWIFMDPILLSFGTTARILPMAREYLGIVMIGFIFQIGSMAVGNSLRSQNRPKTIMVSTISGSVLNAILAPLFIFAFHWGVAGAAWATVIAQALSAALTLYFIQDRKSILKIEAARLAPKAKTVLEMLKLGIPIALVQCLSLVMLVVANNAMARLGGETALAVIGIVNALSTLLIFPIVGIAQGAQALWGYNYGAGKLDRVRSLTKLTLVWTSVLAVLFTLVLELFTRQFVAAFNPKDEALIALGTRGIAIFMLTFFTSGIQFTASMFFMSIGKAGQGGLLYMARNLLSIAGMALLPLVMGLDGVFWTGPACDAISTVLSVLLLASGLKNLKPKDAAQGSAMAVEADASALEPPSPAPALADASEPIPAIARRRAPGLEPSLGTLV
jgi:putative MATE family efflux protein